MALKREIKQGLTLSLMWTFPEGIGRSARTGLAFTSVLENQEAPGEYRVIKTVPANVNIPKKITAEGVENICKQLLQWPDVTVLPG